MEASKAAADHLNVNGKRKAVSLTLDGSAADIAETLLTMPDIQFSDVFVQAERGRTLLNAQLASAEVSWRCPGPTACHTVFVSHASYSIQKLCVVLFMRGTFSQSARQARPSSRLISATRQQLLITCSRCILPHTTFDRMLACREWLRCWAVRKRPA